MSEHRILIDADECIGCGACVRDCPAHNIRIENGRAAAISNACIMCGHCVAICPKAAVSISGYDSCDIRENTAARLDADTVLNVIRQRRSVRRFKDADIPDEIIAQILEAGRLTHTAKNAQDVSFIVLKNEKDEMERLAVGLFRTVKPIADIMSPMSKNVAIDDDFFFFKAPVVIVVAAESDIDGALAAQNMEFVAEANGLGVLYSGFFIMAAKNSPKLRKALNLPKGKKPVAALVLGYPAVIYPRSAPRNALDVTWR